MLKALLGELRGRTREAQSRHGFALPAQDGNAQTCGAEFVFLGIDSVSRQANPRQFVVQGARGRDRILVMAWEAPLADDRRHVDVRQAGQQDFP